MKHLRLFEGYQSEAEVAKICQEYNIKNWSINSEGLVDVDGNVDFFKLQSKKLEKLPLKFGSVTGYFDCDKHQLTTLEGSPHTVGSYFDCGRNKLTSLKGAPKSVGGYFSCSDNQLTSLEGSPIVGVYNGKSDKLIGNFICTSNDIRSFEGLVSISNDFHCSGNPVYEVWSIIKNTDKWDNYKMALFNEYDPIRGDEIIIDRLNSFLEEIGKRTVRSVKGYKNI